MFSLYEFITSEKPYFTQSTDYDLGRIDKMLRPSDEESTDLGDIPQSANKGSTDSRVRPYGFRYNYSLLREDEREEE